MLDEIVICSQTTAEELEPRTGWGVISIRGPGKPVNLKAGWDFVMPLEFNDLISKYAGFTCFDENMARTIIARLDDLMIDDQVKNLVIHCEHGRSRSQALGMFVHEHYAPYLETPAGPCGSAGYNRLVYKTLSKVASELG